MNLARKILIVDDDPNLRETLAEQLRLHEEFDIGEAGSGGEALERAKSQRFDLALLDVGLPDMDGREVCKVMRRCGWRWNRRLTAWTRHLNNAGREAARYTGLEIAKVVRP